MKKINRILIPASIFLSTFSLKALTVGLDNLAFTSSIEILALVDSSGTPLGALDSVEIGFFTDESAVMAGDFSSFNQFGTTLSAVAFGQDGLVSGSYNGLTSGAEAAFVGQNITVFVTNSTNDEWLVAKTNTLFQSDAGNSSLSTPVNLVSLNNAGDITYLFGGAAGPSVDYSALSAGIQPSISTAPIPEPSTYALFAGILSIGFVAVRRRRSRSKA